MSKSNPSTRKPGLITEEKPAGGLSQSDFGHLMEQEEEEEGKVVVEGDKAGGKADTGGAKGTGD